MRIHHFNCGTIRPPSQRLLNGTGSVFAPGKMVTHCLLVEAADGLILVESGIGLADIAEPKKRIGAFFLNAIRPVLDQAETAVRQIQTLGFDPRDVRAVVLTHLDWDHAGGLSDFPDADIHVTTAELDAATHPQTAMEKNRYRTVQWSHGPRWVLHPAGGQQWLDFEGCQPLYDNGPDILLVPLAGHTRGHVGVAVRTDTGWLLHCGDAYYTTASITPDGSCPAGLRLFQRLAGIDNRARERTQQKLGQLRLRTPEGVQLCSAHDQSELKRFIRGAAEP